MVALRRRRREVFVVPTFAPRMKQPLTHDPRQRRKATDNAHSRRRFSLAPLLRGEGRGEGLLPQARQCMATFHTFSTSGRPSSPWGRKISVMARIEKAATSL